MNQEIIHERTQKRAIENQIQIENQTTIKTEIQIQIENQTQTKKVVIRNTITIDPTTNLVATKTEGAESSSLPMSPKR